MNTEHRNFHHLVLEITWFGLATAATSRFLSVFAIRLGATPADLGWLTAAPFLVLLVSTALSSYWRSRFSDSIKAIFWPSLSFRLVFLFPALTPLFPEHLQPAWLIGSAALAALPQGISSTIFVAMLREAVPQERLTALISRRTVGMNIALGIAAIGFGFWLEQAPFPLNYQVMFLAAFVLALLSQLQLMRVKVNPTPIVVQQQKSSVSPLRSSTFQKTLFIGAIIHIGFFALVPVMPLYLVEKLDATEGFMALFGIAEIGAAALISLFTSRIAARIGHRRMIALSMIGTALSALIMGSTHNLYITLLAAGLSGAAWTVAAIGLFGIFSESTQSVANAESNRLTTIYHQVIFLAAFIGPMIGSNLANANVNLVLVMLIGAGLRLIAGESVFYIEAFWQPFQQRARHALRRS